MTAARIGIGGPVGSGKTALTPVLTRRGVDLAIITNDLVTEEDAERLWRSGLIDPLRVAGAPQRDRDRHPAARHRWRSALTRVGGCV